MAAESPQERFARLVEDSIGRLRVSRLRRMVTTSAYAASGVLAIWVAVAIAFESARAVSLFVAAVVCGAIVAAAVIAWLLPVNRAAAVRAIDRDGNLPDSALSAAELDGIADAAWRELQLNDTLARAGTMAAPRRGEGIWPLVFGSGSAVVLLAVLLSLGATAAGNAKSSSRDSALAQHGADLEMLFKDWDKAQQEDSDPKLAELLRDVQPLRDAIAAGKLDRREILLQLSKLEERVAAMQEEQARASLDPHAASLADAMKGVAGTEKLAAALRNKDYSQAKAAAQEFAEKMAQPDAQVPEGAKEAAAQQRMENAAQQMQQAGQQSMSKGMQNMSQAGKKNDSSQMSQGARQISQSMAQQQARQNQSRSLATQQQQIGACKQCMANGESMSAGLSLIPRISTQKSKQPGKGAGSETDPNRYADATDSLGTGNEQHLTGSMNEMGDTEVTTVRTTEAPKQKTVSVATADFAQYRKLSEEAVEDESLPMAHRMTIRRYFESIRPSAANDEPR